MTLSTRERAAEYPLIEGRPEDVAQLFRDRRWKGQDGYWRPWHILVEKNLRMVAGRHWDVYIDILGRFMDIAEFMTDEEKTWRQRPVFNWTGYWYQVTHARLTENPAQVVIVPSSADAKDARTAEVWDPIFRYLWDVNGMLELDNLLEAWRVSTGRAWTKSYWDPDGGRVKEMVAPAMVAGADGQPRVIPEAPYVLHPETGEPVPNLQVRPDGGIEFGQAMRMPEGEIAVDVLSPLEVRTSPEPGPEWRKRWAVQRGVMHVDEVRELYDIEVEPDVQEGSEDEIAKLFFGLGEMGAAAASPRKPQQQDFSKRVEGFVWTYEAWERPRYDVDGMEGGRHVLVVGEEKPHVPVDEPLVPGPDYWPLHAFDFIRVPGRPTGKSPVEDLTPIQQSYNRGWGQILEHRALNTNPIWVSVGVDVEVTNQPGQHINVPFVGPGVQPLQAVTPPPLSADVWRTQEQLLAALQDIGSLRQGSEGRPPTRDPSGELVKELRFNDDRFIGPAAVQKAVTYARMVQEAWVPLVKWGWTEERMIEVSGEDNRARFLMVSPDMLEGRVNVKPVPEALLPEGRGEKQLRILSYYREGLFGPPGSPEASQRFFDLINYPHLTRAARPGGIDREMADWENAQMLRGEMVMPLEVHDHLVHLEVHRQIEATPDFVRLDPNIRLLFETHRRAHEMHVRNAALKQGLQVAAMTDIVGGNGAPAEGQRDSATTLSER